MGYSTSSSYLAKPCDVNKRTEHTRLSVYDYYLPISGDCLSLMRGSKCKEGLIVVSFVMFLL